ncbi:MAG: TFIIB-type zinc ribbon-containing protein [Candidatus Hodarchaeota archaeon]
MKRLNSNNPDNECTHKNINREGGFLVCQDCGLILDDNIAFETPINVKYDKYAKSQQEYERNIRIRDSKALQDPNVKQQYDRISTLNMWYRDYETSFTEQRKMIELLKNYGFNIDNTKFQAIKKRYLKYNRNHRRTYQNMIIIFLAIIWLEIKETTNVRVERYIEVCNELGHKINKKMLNNAMLKVKKTEKMWKKLKSQTDIEKEIKEKIKILFQKDLNSIPYDKVKEFIPHKADFDKLKIEMQILADDLLKKIPYKDLKNLNYKAFTAGLIYYIGQTLENPKNRKMFTQSLIEESTSFSSTTIRKKFNILKGILGFPQSQNSLAVN